MQSFSSPWELLVQRVLCGGIEEEPLDEAWLHKASEQVMREVWMRLPASERGVSVRNMAPGQGLRVRTSKAGSGCSTEKQERCSSKRVLTFTAWAVDKARRDTRVREAICTTEKAAVK